MRRLFLCSCLLPLAGNAAECLPERIDEDTLAVAWVHDGDTIKLKDGRKVRLIGIDTPELGRDGKPHQPFAAQAREQLRQQLKAADMQISLSYGEDRRDRYGRLLAHVSVQSDGERRNVNATMLQQGLAVAYTTPPNDGLSACYQKAEDQASSAGTGIWSHPRYQPVSADQLLRHSTGFRIIDTVIDKVDAKRKGTWLRALPLQVYIARRDLRNFDEDWLQSLQGERVRIRGWVHKDRNSPASKRFMKIRHPAAIYKDELRD